jgi:hypothetical protein
VAHPVALQQWGEQAGEGGWAGQQEGGGKGGELGLGLQVTIEEERGEPR